MTDRGFTLVEMVVGIVVLAIAMLIMNTLIISQSKDSLEPLYRLRASQLGQGIMQTILSRAYDENSDHNGGLYRCGETWQPQNSVQSCSTTLGIDGSEVAGEHDGFNDVDDFITSGFQSAVDYGDVLDNALSDEYSNYAVSIDVNHFDATTKQVVVIIQTPSAENIRLSAFKGNY